MNTNNLKLLPVLALLLLLGACSQEVGVEDAETPELPAIIPDEPTQIDIQETALPIIEDFSATNAEAFFSPGYKSLVTPAGNQIVVNGNPVTLTDPWPSFYYPTCCFFRTDSGTGELIRTAPFSSDIPARFRVANNKLQMSNSRFSIGQILSDLTPNIPERKSDTTDSPQGASLALGSWGELNLTQPYRVSFCLVDYGVQGTGNSNLEVWVDNNSGGRSDESIHGVSSLLLRAALVSAPVVVSGRRIVVDVPGEAYMVDNSGARVGPTLGVIQPLALPNLPAGTFSSFLQMRVSNGAYVVISDMVIERQTQNNASGMTCTADPVFYSPPYPADLELTPGDSQLGVTWEAVTGATGYDIAYNTTDSLSGATIVPVAGGGTASHTITGLTNGTTYFVFISARYTAENSEYSPGESAVVNPPPVPPATPGILNLNASNTSIDVVWSTDGNATSYDVAYNTADTLSGATVVNVAATGANLTGLTNGTPYFVFVRANNNVGSSAYTSSVSATPSAASTWQSVDVGAASGTTIEDTNTVTITGQGQTNTTGQIFRYVYTPIQGDFTFTARLASFNFNGVTANGGRIGLFATPDFSQTGTNMLYGAAFFRADNSHVRGQRVSAGTNSGTSTVTPAGSGDFYIRLQKTGGTMRAAFSRDGGVTYAVSNATAAYTPALPDTVYVGFHVNANLTTAGTATFDNVSIVGANGTTTLVGPNEFAAGVAPAAPAAPVLTPDNMQLGVTWGAVSGATGYDVIYNTTNSESGATTFASNIPGTSTTITGLANGTTYFVFVRAKNSFGDSAYSPGSSAVPALPPPAAPAAPTLTPGDTTIGVTWGAISLATGYDVIYNTVNSESGATAFSGNPVAGTNATLTGLTNGTTYFVFVRAKNAAGDSAYSPSSSATPTQSPPAAPSAPSLTPGDTTIGVTWSAVSGSTGYDVIYNTVNSESGATAFSGNPVAGTNATLTGLTNGTEYWVFVRAKNAAGDSAYSPSSSAIPVPPVPSAPAAPALVPQNAAIDVSWGAVSGATGYDVIYNTTNSESGATAFSGNPVAGTSATISGLANGTTYFVFVRAKNLGGDSAYSTGTSVTAGVPLMPTGLALVPGNTEIAATWNAGAGITPTAYDIAYNTSNPNDPNAVDAMSGTMLDVPATNATLTGLFNDETYFVFVRAKTAAGTSAYTASRAATPLPANPWTALNLDAITGATVPGTAPTGTIDASTPTSITISGSGGAVSSDSHRLFFAYRLLARSSITITARIASITATPAGSTNNFRFGMMLTDKINTSVATYADAGSWGDIGFYYNATPALVGSRGQMTEANARSRSDVAGLAVGHYIRIEIFDDGVNKRIRRHTSTDGVTFTQQNSTTDFQADSVDDTWYWGFYIASGANAVTLTFDNIRVTSP